MSVHKVRLQATFIWRIKDGSVKANDTNVAVAVYAISRDGRGNERTTNITTSCEVAQQVVDATSGLHVIEAIHDFDSTVMKPVQYIIVCRDNTADQHVFLSAKVLPGNWKKDEIYVYPVVQQ